MNIRRALYIFAGFLATICLTYRVDYSLGDFFLSSAIFRESSGDASQETSQKLSLQFMIFTLSFFLLLSSCKSGMYTCS